MKKFALVVTLFLAAFAVNAQTADEVVNKYIAASGGVDNWKKINGIKSSGFFIMQGLNIPCLMIQERPNKNYVEGEFQGNKFIDVYDGTIAWGQNPFGGPAKPTQKTEEETKEMAKEQFEDDFIGYAAKGHTVELNGTEEIEGTKCYKVTLKRKSGDEKIYFFDAETYLPICIRSFLTSGPAKGQAQEMFPSDYKTIEGVQIAHTMEQKMGGQVMMTIKMEKIEINPTIDAAQYAMPK
jgi:outer membrane lipoprotein-sorting protein